MPKHSRHVTWRRMKVTNSKGQYRITFPKDFAESNEVLEGTFIYNPIKKQIIFRKTSEVK